MQLLNYLTSASPPVDESMAEIIPHKLYFQSLRASVTSPQLAKLRAGKSPKNAQYICIDSVLTYEAFAADFGPLNISKVVKFIDLVKNRIQNKRPVVIFTCSGPEKRSNAAYLVGCYQVIVLNRKPEDAYARLVNSTPYKPFRDASMGISTWDMTILQCLNALSAALRLKFFDPETFDASDFDYYEKVENGDLTVVVPNKFIHLAGPSDKKFPEDSSCFGPEQYIENF